MKKYFIYLLIGAIIVIIGALLKILKIYDKVEYIYIVGFIIEAYGIVGIIKTFKDK